MFDMVGWLTHICHRGWNHQTEDHSVSTAKIIQPSRPIVSCALFSWPNVRCSLGGYTHTVIHPKSNCVFVAVCWETIHQHSAIMFAHCRLKTLRGIRHSNFDWHSATPLKGRRVWNRKGKFGKMFIAVFLITFGEMTGKLQTLELQCM